MRYLFIKIPPKYNFNVLHYNENAGVSSSYTLAANDARNMLQWKCMIAQVADELSADAAYIAGSFYSYI